LVTRPAIVASFFLLLASLVPAGTVLAGKDEPQPIVVKEPHYGEVLFYFYQEDYFPAIVRLLAAQEQGKLEQHAAQADLLKGGLYLSYGHHLEAADIFERLLADNVNPEIRDRTWFFLAKIWRQRGYLDKAQRALDNIGRVTRSSISASPSCAAAAWTRPARSSQSLAIWIPGTRS
jgi:tetratricopeptide (TPR) repeat protein